MALILLLISCAIAFPASVFWVILQGGSLLTFVMVYAASGQLIFIAMLSVYYVVALFGGRRASHNMGNLPTSSGKADAGGAQPAQPAQPVQPVRPVRPAQLGRPVRLVRSIPQW